MRTASSSAGGAAPAIALCASRSRASGSMRRLYPTMGAVPPGAAPSAAIARLYDPWSRSVVEDVDFYVEEAVAAGGPVVELGVGTGRIAVPVAEAGVRVIGVDSSAAMLEVCAERAAAAGVGDRLDLRLGDLRDPPVRERVALVTCPFRAYLHLRSDDERRHALRRAHDLLVAGGPPLFH